jgi:hypothetical protein
MGLHSVRAKMAAKSFKNKSGFSQAAFVRQTIQSNLLEGIIEIPGKLKNRLVEIILLPLDSGKSINHGKPGTPLNRLAGAWAGEPLVREEQGNYEAREELM